MPCQRNATLLLLMNFVGSSFSRLSPTELCFPSSCNTAVLLPYVSPTALMHSGPFGVMMCVCVTRVHTPYASLLTSLSPAIRSCQRFAVRVSGGGESLFLLWMLPRFYRCSSLATAVGVCIGMVALELWWSWATLYVNMSQDNLQ